MIVILKQQPNRVSGFKQPSKHWTLHCTQLGKATTWHGNDASKATEGYLSQLPTGLQHGVRCTNTKGVHAYVGSSLCSVSRQGPRNAIWVLAQHLLKQANVSRRTSESSPAQPAKGLENAQVGSGTNANYCCGSCAGIVRIWRAGGCATLRICAGHPPP